MTQVCSLPSSAASVSDTCQGKRLPKGIHIVETSDASGSKVEAIPHSTAPWGYLFIQHFAAEKFEARLKARTQASEFVPRCFIHRTIRYKRKPNGKGVMKEEKPSVSGLIFLQGETAKLRQFLQENFPQYHLVNNCTTGQPASIPDAVMRPFMQIAQTEPERVTFLRDSFQKFAKDHVRLRVLTGLFKGQEGYVVRILRDRHLVMEFGGYAIAISNVHQEDFEVVE